MKETIVLGIRYTGEEMKDYHRVKELAEKNKDPLSTTGKLLINRGLIHTDNPEPLVKVVEKIKEVPVEKIVKVPVYRDPPKVDKSKSHIKDHITDDIGGGVQTQLRPSADKLSTGNKAEPSPNTALDIKKSANDEGSNIGGWIMLSGILAVLFGPVVYRWLTPKKIEPVNQIGKPLMHDQIDQPNEFTEQVDQRFI